MAKLTWDILRPVLADPATKIIDGKYLAIAEGGGITVNGFGFQLDDTACGNVDLLELIVLLYQSHNRVLNIYCAPNFPNPSNSGQYPFLIAAIADFHGVRHDFNRNKYPQAYENVAQRIYAAFRPHYPGYEPPEKLYVHPGLWLKDTLNSLPALLFGTASAGFFYGVFTGNPFIIPGLVILLTPAIYVLVYVIHWLECNIINPVHKRRWGQLAFMVSLAILPLFYLLRFTGNSALQINLPWEYDYNARYEKNPAYDKLGKDAAGYTELVRAFKAKHPDKFAEVVKSLKDDLRRYDASQVVTPGDNSILWRLNTDEAQRLIRANMNIKIMHNPYATPNPEPGWLTEQQAVAIIVQQADQPITATRRSTPPKPVSSFKLPFKLPWEYDYVNRYGNNRAYDDLGKDAESYTQVVRDFYAKHRLLAFKMFNEYGVFKGLPKESLYLNINTDEAQRFLRATANIKQHNSKPIGSVNPSSGWLTEQQAGAIIIKEVPDPPRKAPKLTGMESFDALQRKFYDKR